ncbi:MAG: hypothetical protein U9Q67_04605 [Patescibacteria group bacterium]|nr:hypothetical protein [Patescibacteria group bacterium]
MTNLLNKLLDKQTLVDRKNKYYLSLYLPVTEENRDNVDTYIKSFVLQSLRKNKKLAQKTRLHKNVISKILEKLASYAKMDLGRGVGIFIEFNAYEQEKGRVKGIADSEIEIVVFSRKPKREIFIGNVYRLDQLIWQDNVYIEALILNIDKKKCDIYEIEGNQIDKLNTLKNTTLKDEKEFSRVYSPTGNIATTHGTGGSIKRRSERESSKAFLKEVTEYLGSVDTIKSRFEYLIVLYSDPYSDFIKKSMKEDSISGDFIPMLINKNVEYPNKILKLVRDRIQEFQKITKTDRLEISRENYSHYCEGWLEITKAINMSQVSRLFVKPAVIKEGYLDTKTKLIFTYPKKGSIKVRNIVPWSIVSVIDKGGDVIILRGERYKNSTDVAAQLRYAKKRQLKNNPIAIKKWAIERNGTPAIVKDTEDLLRIKFSDSETDLIEISWNKFFQILDDNRLILVYDVEKDSRFCTFVNKE